MRCLMLGYLRMKITRLTRDDLLKNMDVFLEIDSITDADECWQSDNFLMELDGKWDNSYVVWMNGKVVGYIICSQKNEEVLHIHRFAVSHEYQKMGIGTQLVRRIIENFVNAGIKCVTLKVRNENCYAQKFYEKNDFKQLHSEGNNYVYGRML